MLVEFSVENYRSIKEKVTFSMLASDDTEHEDTNVTTLPDGKRLLKSAVIYGANASGKSNLMLAMDFMSVIVFRSRLLQPDEPIEGVIPFKLDEGCKNKPSKFDVIFYFGAVKYAYGFSATNREILEEYLYSFPNGSEEPQLLFLRDTTAEKEYQFTDDGDKVLLEHICQFNAKNKLYLSTAVLLNYKKFIGVYNWLCDFYLYNFNAPYNILRNGFFDKNANAEKAQSYIKKVVQWVKEIDVGITNVKIKENRDLFVDDYSSNNDNWDKYIKILNNIETTHEVFNPDGTISEIDFKFFSDESAGTKNFFSVALDAAKKMVYGGVFLADEFNTNLHTLLVKYIVNLFNSPNKNPLHSQLIFTTHDTNLLDLDLLRRDQIWFTEKNPDTGATEIYSLSDFEIDENGKGREANIEKGYLLGIYGAIPFIKGDTNG